MENWMQKYENRQEKTYEEILKNQLNTLLDLVDNSVQYKMNDMQKALIRIVELYEKLKNSGYDFDEKDMIFRKKQLVELRFKIQKREHMESYESESWNEFEENEKQDDEEER